MSDTFTTVMIEEIDGKPNTHFREIHQSDLPDLDVLIEVDYSALNYKDGLALANNKNKVVRNFPMIGGIDLAGTVIESRSPKWQPGNKVVLNGFGLSETQWGGFTRYQRVRGEWLVRLPENFSTLQAMAIGTAGYTAALSVEALLQWGHAQPEKGKILVTGAAGGVGSVAIALLARAGFHVTASTGRTETQDYLRELGANEVIDRVTLQEAGSPLQRETWAGAVDSVGGQTLANILAQMEYGAAATTCGLVGGMNLPGTVLPHILRGVALLGIDSVMAPMSKREAAWARLARDMDPQKLDAMTTVAPMSELKTWAQRILEGKTQGRVVIDVKR